MEQKLTPQLTRNISTNTRLPAFRDQGAIGWWEEGENGELGIQRIETLKRAWLAGFLDEMACALAGISIQQLYYYQKKNNDFLKEKEALKLNVSMNAQFTISKAVETNLEAAWRYLAKKFPKEYGENPEGAIINYGTMNTQINSEEYEKVPDNVDELLDGDEIKT